jgi:putative ABC transport system ATP-binding protein
MTSGVTVRCRELRQVYRIDGEAVTALADADLEVAAGEGIAISGPSGSGKSTLTSILAGLRRPTAGRVQVGADELTAMSERQLLRWRGRGIGVVLQNPSRSLLPYASPEQNVYFARRSRPRSERFRPARELLAELGLAELAGHRVARLSGGEQQRVSVAVAMATEPQLLVADEPTSQLDAVNRDRAVDLLLRVNEHFGTTLIMVTHDEAVAERLPRQVRLAEGRVVSRAF